MTPLIPGMAAALIVAGAIGVVIGVRGTPEKPAAPTRKRGVPGLSRVPSMTKRSQQLVIVGAGVGLLVAILTGWVVAVILVPAIIAGLPWLLSSPEANDKIERLQAMEEWTRSLSGILTVGTGLEQALIATLRSTPDEIRPEVARLASRLRARWSTEDALRAFADELDDATGDLISANLILAARRRGSGLAAVLEALAESVAADVRARREIEADRAKPRATARAVTFITLGVLGFLALNSDYIEPYRSPLGQIILVTLLALYVATLIWMKRMAIGGKLPRFIGVAAKEAAN